MIIRQWRKKNIVLINECSNDLINKGGGLGVAGTNFW